MTSADQMKTVFISYRRTKFALAQAVKFALDKAGFNVFLDVDDLAQGDFLSNLEHEVKRCTHFIPILTMDSVERCINDDDVVRKEMEWALESERNIVPLMFEGFKFSDARPYLRGKLSTLGYYAGVTVPEDYFEEGINRLITRFLTNIENIKHPRRSKIMDEWNTSEIVGETAAIKAERLLIRSQQSIGNRYRAIDYLSQALEIKPDFVEAYYLRGKAHSFNREPEMALLDWKRGLEIIASSALQNREIRVKQHLLTTLIKLVEKHYGAAHDEVRKAIDLDPLNYDAHYICGQIEGRRQNHEKAIQHYSDSISLNPNFAGAYNNRGSAHTANKEYDKALLDFSSAIRVEPDYAAPYVNRGELYFIREQYNLAYEEFRHVLGLSPTSPTGLAGLAISAYQLGEKYEALRLWKFLIKTNSIYGEINNFDPILEKLGYMYHPHLGEIALEVAISATS